MTISAWGLPFSTIQRSAAGDDPAQTATRAIAAALNTKVNLIDFVLGVRSDRVICTPYFVPEVVRVGFGLTPPPTLIQLEKGEQSDRSLAVDRALLILIRIGGRGIGFARVDHLARNENRAST